MLRGNIKKRVQGSAELQNIQILQENSILASNTLGNEDDLDQREIVELPHRCQLAAENIGAASVTGYIMHGFPVHTLFEPPCARTL